MDPLTVKWEELFETQPISAIRKFRDDLGVRRVSHKAEVAERIGGRHAEIVDLARRIGNLTAQATVHEQALQALTGPRDDSGWAAVARNADGLHVAGRTAAAAHARQVLASRLLAFAQAEYLCGRLVAAARALFLCRMLGVPSLAGALAAKEHRLAAAVGRAVDGGRADALVQEALRAYLIVHRVPPSQLVSDLLRRRRARLEAQPDTDFLGTLALVESTAFLLSQTFDYFFKFNLSAVRLVDTPELDDPRLNLAEFIPFLSSKALEAQAFPSESYGHTASFETERVQQEFDHDAVALLDAKFRDAIARAPLADLNKLFSDVHFRVRDSSELSELASGELVSKVLFQHFAARFETLALEDAALLDDLDIKTVLNGNIKSAQNYSSLDFDLTIGVEELAKVLHERSSGQVGVAAAPLKGIRRWGRAVAAIQEQAAGLGRLAAGVRGPGRSQLERLRDDLGQKLASAVTSSYEKKNQEIGDLLADANAKTVAVLALLATLKRDIDAQLASLTGLAHLIDGRLLTTLYERLAQALVNTWFSSGDLSEDALDGFPSTQLLGKLLDLVRTMESVLDGFLWTPEALQAVRSLVVAKVEAVYSAAAKEPPQTEAAGKGITQGATSASGPSHESIEAGEETSRLSSPGTVKIAAVNTTVADGNKESAHGEPAVAEVTTAELATPTEAGGADAPAAHRAASPAVAEVDAVEFVRALVGGGAEATPGVAAAVERTRLFLKPLAQ